MNTLVPIQWSTKAVLPCNTQNKRVISVCVDVCSWAQTRICILPCIEKYYSAEAWEALGTIGCGISKLYHM